MKKKKWNRFLPALLVMVTAISLLSGCVGKSAEKEDADDYGDNLTFFNSSINIL